MGLHADIICVLRTGVPVGLYRQHRSYDVTYLTGILFTLCTPDTYTKYRNAQTRNVWKLYKCTIELTAWKAEVQFPSGARIFSLLHSVQTGSGAHSTSYSVDTGGSLPGLKRPGRETDHSLHLMARSRMVELYLYSSYEFIS
jgi:hypothetical protein